MTSPSDAPESGASNHFALDGSVDPGVLFGAVLGAIGEAVFVVRPSDRTIILSNAAAAEIFGVDPGELVGSDTRILHASDEDYRMLAERGAAQLELGRPYHAEHPFRKWDGEVFDASVRITAVDPEDWRQGVVCVLRDVSTLRAAQGTASQATAELEQRVSELRCLQSVATTLVDHGQSLEEALRRTVELLPRAVRHPQRASAEGLYGGLRVTSSGPLGDGPGISSRFEGLEGSVGTLVLRYARDLAKEEGGGPEEGGESPVFRPEEQNLLDAVAALFETHVRAREQKERTRLERDRFFELFRASPVAMALSDADTSVFMEVNDHWCRVTGYDRDEIVGSSTADLVLWDRPEERESLRSRLGEEGMIENFHLRFRRRDGAVREASGSALQAELEGRTVWFSTLHDVTEQVRLEEERARMVERRAALERLGAIGELAGGVAHDINNLLLPILVNIDLALPGASAELEAQLQEIRESALRGRTLTRKLLTFAQRQTLHRTTLDLDDVLRSAEPVLRGLLPETVTLEVEPAGDLPSIRIDAAQVEQALVSLVTNARDAVEGDGRIRISTYAREVADAGDFGVKGSGCYVYLEVGDDGRGIPQEAREKIFEPFFSTKHATESTGLGLSTVLGVVEQHGGYIELDTETGRGTELRLGFPCALEAEATDAEVTEGPMEIDASRGEGKTVLIVEDDTAVRAVTGRALRAYGFETLAAADAPTALELLDSHGRRIDLIISDIVMPGMTGLDLRAELQKRTMDIPMLFVSGYSWGALEEHGVDPDAFDLLQKPFSPSQLVDAVLSLIAQEEGP